MYEIHEANRGSKRGGGPLFLKARLRETLKGSCQKRERGDNSLKRKTTRDWGGVVPLTVVSTTGIRGKS